jgi:hypothetical protein
VLALLRKNAYYRTNYNRSDRPKKDLVIKEGAIIHGSSDAIYYQKIIG